MTVFHCGSEEVEENGLLRYRLEHFLLLYFYGCEYFAFIYGYVPLACSTLEGQKRALGSLKLEL